MNTTSKRANAWCARCRRPDRRREIKEVEVVLDFTPELYLDALLRSASRFDRLQTNAARFDVFGARSRRFRRLPSMKSPFDAFENIRELLWVLKEEEKAEETEKEPDEDCPKNGQEEDCIGPNFEDVEQTTTLVELHQQALICEKNMPHRCRECAGCKAKLAGRWRIFRSVARLNRSLRAEEFLSDAAAADELEIMVMLHLMDPDATAAAEAAVRSAIVEF